MEVKEIATQLAAAQARIAELEAENARLERFKEIAEHSDSIITLIGPDGSRLYQSPAITRITGYDENDLSGLGTFAHIHPDDLPSIQQTLAELLQDPQGSRTVEYRYLRKNGTIAHVQTVAQNLLHIPKLQAVLANTYITTEQKEIEITLQESEANLRTVFENMQDTFYRTDIQGNLIMVSPSAAILLGYNSPKEMYGINIAKEHYAYPENRQALLKELKEKGRVTDYEVVLRRRDGSQLTVSTNSAYYRNRFGEIAGVEGIFRDITARKQADAEREKLQQQIIEAQQRAIKELAAPIIPITDRILAMPLIGSIDTLRARDIMHGLLGGIGHYHARVIILDITGVPIIDSNIADHLNKAIQAARLKGATVIITGISDAVAEEIVDLGLDWSNIETHRDLQSGLQAAHRLLKTDR